MPKKISHNMSQVSNPMESVSRPIQSEVSLGSDESEFDYSFCPPQSLIMQHPKDLNFQKQMREVPPPPLQPSQIISFDHLLHLQN